ncbi:hypothetical protein Mgra_00006400 [Meloidogyne graminicola]|uniref:Uncharacterized protein n=1 Tax=Meloidogyne graminicola TaxID=189291 RepID=A0A8S9ZLV5_9BILA|nr:hypothetical protein Mgra_00006400 [Meloidogyne graminicola]
MNNLKYLPKKSILSLIEFKREKRNKYSIICSCIINCHDLKLKLFRVFSSIKRINFSILLYPFINKF